MCKYKETVADNNSDYSWKEQYNSLLTSPTISFAEIDDARSIKNENLPSKIYRFRKANKPEDHDREVENREINAFDNNKVWLCSPEKYNDPYECCTWHDYKTVSKALQLKKIDEFLSTNNLESLLSKNEIAEAKNADDPISTLGYILLKKDEKLNEGKINKCIKCISETIKNEHNEIIQYCNHILQRGMKVCTFSESFDSIVLWAHYASNHRGFCLEYDVYNWSLRNIQRQYLYPVIYSKKLFDATKYLLSIIDYNELNPLFAILATIHKSPEWAYEKEWRFVLPLGESNPDQNFEIHSPSGLYLGLRIETGYKERLVEVAKKKRIPVYQMIQENDRFELKPERCL